MSGRAGRVFVLYGLSGFVSLGYQVAWFRIFVDRFGSTNLTFALVLSNFIAGLGIGALASRPVGAWVMKSLRLGSRLRAYGAVELIVTATVLLTVLASLLPPDAWGSFPYELRDGIFMQTRVYQGSQVLLATLCVFVPCFFMGVTFPLICHAFQGTGGERFPSALYAWNTLGACAGVIACQFLLLPWIGHTRTFLVMALTNLAIGLYFLAAGRDPAPDTAPDTPPAAAPKRRRGKRAAAAAEARAAGAGVFLACAVISGFLAGAMEGDLFKRISFGLTSWNATMPMISFWAILAIFLASWTVRSIPALRLVHIKVAFAGALVYLLAVWKLINPVLDWLRSPPPAALAGEASRALAEARFDFPSSLGQLLLVVGITVFPPFFLISTLLPWVCNRLQARRRHLGLAYGANTVAFCAGAIGFTLVAPRVNIFYSTKLFLILLAVGTGLLFLLAENRRLAPWKVVAALAATTTACLVTPAGFDRSYVSTTSPAARYPVRALMSNGANTTYIVSIPQDDRLFFDNFSMSGSNVRAQTYMRLMAHFPLLAHSRPGKALLICFGVGNTASAIAAHETIQRIDAVDLNHNVFRTAPEFSATNGRVHADPRLRMIHDDGRNFLNLTDETYDLITSEPPPPMTAGVYRLYSREYYETAKARLGERGMMTQWLPVHVMPAGAVDIAISTFLSVFPHTLLFTGVEEEFILVGSPSPIDLELLERRFGDSAGARRDLERVGITSALSLLARIVMTDGTLRQRYGGAPVISDEHNDMEHLFPDRTRPPVIPYDPVTLLADGTVGTVGSIGELRGIVTHLGRLHHHVPGFPVESLMTVREARGGDVALAGLDWRAIARGIREAAAARRAGRNDEAADRLLEVLEISDELPNPLLKLAELRIEAGEYAQAESALMRFLEIEPRDPMGHYSLGLLNALTGRTGEAVVRFRTALTHNPGWPRGLTTLAWTLITAPGHGRPGEALALAERAVRGTGRQDAEALHTLAAALASGGRFDEAAASGREALELAETSGNEALSAVIREHLGFYLRQTAGRGP